MFKKLGESVHLTQHGRRAQTRTNISREGCFEIALPCRHLGPTDHTLAFPTKRWIVTISTLCVLSCKSGQAPGSISHEDGFSRRPENELCTESGQPAKPMVVEWSAADRASLEARLGRGSVLAVSYSDCVLRTLPRCQTDSRYNYFAVNEKTDAVAIRNSTDLYTKLPLGAFRLESKLARSGQLTIETHLVGMFESESLSLGRDELTGECRDATHILLAAQVGSYEFFEGSLRATSASAKMAHAAAGGSRSAGREVLSRDGDAAACRHARRSDTAPPPNCGALIRLELSPLVPPDSSRAPSENSHGRAKRACPPSTVPGGGDTCTAEPRDTALAATDLSRTVELARSALKARDLAKARRYAQEGAALFSSSGQEPGTPAADFAAEAAFILAEVSTAEMVKLLQPATLRSLSSTKQAQLTTSAVAKLNTARSQYAAVARHSRVSWTFAATFGRASACDQFGVLIESVLPPPELFNDEPASDEYKAQLYDRALSFYNCADKGYRTVATEAKRLHFDSEWVQRANRRTDPFGE